jgi:hypothetical protein
VRWNNDDRSALRNVPCADVPRLYKAMRAWNKLITSQDSEYWFKLTPLTVIGAFSSAPPHFIFRHGCRNIKNIFFG